jgi:hypothetical protein
VLKEEINLDLADVRKGRREWREHLVWNIVDGERLLDVLHCVRQHELHLYESTNYLICTLLQIKETKFYRSDYSE